MLDIRRLTNKPTIVFNFRALSENPEIVVYWVEVNARGKVLNSDGMPVDSAEWPAHVYANLSLLSEAYKAAVSVSNKLWAELPPEVTLADIETYLKNHPENVGDSTHGRLQDGFVANMKFWKTFDRKRQTNPSVPTMNLMMK